MNPNFEGNQNKGHGEIFRSVMGRGRFKVGPWEPENVQLLCP